MLNPWQLPACVTDLDEHMGGFLSSDGPFSLDHAMSKDEQDELPQEAIDALLAHQVHHHYVPTKWGGMFDNADTFMQLGRAIARRNMSTAVSFSTMLWSFTGWIGADDRLKSKWAYSILVDQNFPCLAYSERSHGADLLANECTADPEGNTYRLNGEKWPINRASTGQSVVALARTDAATHARNHTLFFIEKKDLAPDHYEHLPRTPLYGLAGCDVSGIAFRNAAVSAESRIGADGSGLEIALKGFQVTRTFCAALSLGAADSMLRIATLFSQQRTHHQQPIISIPFVRSQLARAYLCQLMSEAVSLVAARGLHQYPEQFSAWSSMVKVECAHMTKDISDLLTEVMGARFYLRNEFMGGAFQKFVRDSAIVPIFDGSTPVCLDSLSTLLPSMVKARQKQRFSGGESAALFDRSSPLPPMKWDGLDLFNRGRDAVHESMTWMEQELQALNGDALVDADFIQAFIRDFEQLKTRIALIDQWVLEESAQRSHQNSSRMLHLARLHCEMHRTLCCVGLWLANRGQACSTFFAQGEWAHAALHLTVAHGTEGTPCLSPHLENQLLQQLVHQVTHHQMLSLLEWPVHA